MIENISPACPQVFGTNENNLSAKIYRLLSQENPRTSRNYLQDAQPSFQGFHSFPPTKCGHDSIFPSSTFQQTPPSSRTPSPEQDLKDDSIFRFDSGFKPYRYVGPITQSSCSDYSVSDSRSSFGEPGHRAFSPIASPSSVGLPMSDSFPLQFRASSSGTASPLTPPPVHGLPVTEPLSPPSSSSKGSLLMSPASPSAELMSSLLQDPRWSPSLFSGEPQKSVDARWKELLMTPKGSTEPTYTWTGQLPPRVHKNPVYSIKVFLGGVPWDITEAGLQQAFRPFGTVKVEWPGKDGKQNRHPPKVLNSSPPKGYVYLLFDSEKSVKSLLANCTHDFSNGGDWYYKISSRRMRSKEVQVIPWVLSDSNYAKNVTHQLDSTKTVFVGGLHGMINAEALALIMNQLFDGVVYAGIDTDKHKYPIGSGRVSFDNSQSYAKAVQAAFIEIRTPKFTKKVQIDPYLEDSICNTCHINPGPFFCRDPECFRYFCLSCWKWHHSIEGLKQHRPITRHSKNSPSGY